MPSQKVNAFGSFEGWSRLVREALVWAGQPDPCATRAKLAEQADTTTDALGQLIAAIKQYDVFNRGVIVSEMLGRLYAKDNRPTDEPDNAMRAALENLVGCAPGKVPSPRQVGIKLRSFRRRVVGGHYIDIKPGNHKSGGVWEVRNG
jgi:hypothetical protein